jgi:hypothetical protein
MYAKKGVFRAGEWQKVKGKGFYYVGMKIVRIPIAIGTEKSGKSVKTEKMTCMAK